MTADYHEVFWATLAGVAALVAVALAVSVAVAMRLRVPEAELDNTWSDRLRRAFLYWIALVAYIIQIIILFGSLNSLASKRDLASRTGLLWMEIVSIAALPAIGWMADWLKRSLDKEDQE